MAESRVQVSLFFFSSFSNPPNVCAPWLGYTLRSRVTVHRGLPPPHRRRSHASVTIRWIQTVWGTDRVQRCLTIALPVAACRFRFGERHGQSSRQRLGGEAEPPLEKLQVDHRPGAEEGIPQTVSLRWADFQHARKCAAAAAARERASEQPTSIRGSSVAVLPRCGSAS